MSYKFEYYPDRKKEWRWRLKAGNGQIVADSGEGYTTKSSCLAAIERVKSNIKGATVTEVAR